MTDNQLLKDDQFPGFILVKRNKNISKKGQRMNKMEFFLN
jgi:hypothetical protein